MSHEPRPQEENDPRFRGLDDPVGPLAAAPTGVEGGAGRMRYSGGAAEPRADARAYRKPIDVAWAVLLALFAVALVVAAVLNMTEPTGTVVLAVVFAAMAVGVGFMVRALLEPLTDAQRELERLKFEAPRARARRRRDMRFKKDVAITDIDDV